MSQVIEPSPETPKLPPVATAPPLTPKTRMVQRHSLAVRLTHWLIVLVMPLMLLSGLQIFNAHAALYWGEQSDFKHPWLEMSAENDNGNLHGFTQIFGWRFSTTGWLGASKDEAGNLARRGFPSWLTVPSWRDLATGRQWHFFFAWIFVITGLVYWAYSLVSGHLRRDLLPTRQDWLGIGRSILDHARFRHPHGELAARYNVLQRLSYLGVGFALAPLMVLSGLALSPRWDSTFSWLVVAMGGHQSARSLHFLFTLAFVMFVGIHVFEVVITGLVNNLRSMITGRYRIEISESQNESAK